ncbi:hypothetical protein M0R45_019381 [Rubus argutus]|uniref:Uncharacterized protein n=1 Tax=Rubus argutus TaxID=59490 RepID=A0AAW1X724_RUBAR
MLAPAPNPSTVPARQNPSQLTIIKPWQTQPPFPFFPFSVTNHHLFSIIQPPFSQSNPCSHQAVAFKSFHLCLLQTNSTHNPITKPEPETELPCPSRYHHRNTTAAAKVPNAPSLPHLLKSQTTGQAPPFKVSAAHPRAAPCLCLIFNHRTAINAQATPPFSSPLPAPNHKTSLSPPIRRAQPLPLPISTPSIITAQPPPAHLARASAAQPSSPRRRR